MPKSESGEPPPVQAGDALQPEAEVLVVNLDWTKPLFNYILQDILPQDKDEVRSISRCAKAYTIIAGQLYKRSTFVILQWCISKDEGGRSYGRFARAPVAIM